MLNFKNILVLILLFIMSCSEDLILNNPCDVDGPQFECWDASLACGPDDCPPLVGCMDPSACNYNKNELGEETIFEESCTDDCCIYSEDDCYNCGDPYGDGLCGGVNSCAIDECGVCGGGGIEEGKCDCDGNVEDCAGECGGLAVIDECGDCEGDGIQEGDCDCDGNVFDVCNVCDGPGAIYNCGCDQIEFGLNPGDICDCDENVFDCALECGGSAVPDACGNCGGNNFNTNEYGSCDCQLSGSVFMDCAGVCNGSAVEDECGVCNGNGIPDGFCDCDFTPPEINKDCDGNCLVDVDCNGFCGGTSELDDCGVCGGPGADISCDDGSFVCDESDCQEPAGGISNGCDLSENEVYVTPTGDVLYNIPTDIAGWQFSVEGATASAAAGGESGAVGFTMTAGGGTVLAFSFTGATITTDCGLLVSLTLDGTPAGLTDLVFSDSDASTIEVSYYSGSGGSTDILGCIDQTACNFNADATLNDGSCCFPNSNLYDCEGNCLASIDCAGFCGGDYYTYYYTQCGSSSESAMVSTSPDMITDIPYNYSVALQFDFFNLDPWMTGFKIDLYKGNPFSSCPEEQPQFIYTIEDSINIVQQAGIFWWIIEEEAEAQALGLIPGDDYLFKISTVATEYEGTYYESITFPYNNIFFNIGD